MVDDQGNEADLEYTEPEDAYIEELKWGRDLTDTDDPKRGACSRSNESCRKSTVEVTEPKHDDKGNINLPHAETEHMEWKKKRTVSSIASRKHSDTCSSTLPVPDYKHFKM